MKRERLKKLTADVRRHFPPPSTPGKVVLVKVYSDRMLSDEELGKRAGPPKPREHRILLNIIKVRPFKRQASAEDVSGARTTSPAPGLAASEEAALEAEVRRLERRKAELERRAREAADAARRRSL
jgi:hypothetical protein